MQGRQESSTKSWFKHRFLFLVKFCYIKLVKGLNMKNTATILGLAVLMILNVNPDLYSLQTTANIVFDLRSDGSSRGQIRNTVPSESMLEYQPYLHDKTRPTHVVLLSGETFDDYMLYNLETESLETADKTKQIPWSEIRTFIFNPDSKKEKQTFTNMKILWPENEFGGFMQDVESSPLVKVNYYLQFVPKSWNPSTQMGDRNDQIVRESMMYLKVNEIWVEIPSSKTAFFELFGNYSETLRKYARKNRLKHTDTEDVGEMVTWVTTRR